MSNYISKLFKTPEEFEEHVNHDNKAVLDGITAALVDAWNKKGVSVQYVNQKIQLLDKDGNVLGEASLEDLETRVTGLDKSLDSLSKQTNEISGDLDAVTERTTVVEARATALESRADDLEMADDSIYRDIDGLSERTLGVEDRTETAETNITTLFSRTASTAAKVDDIDQAINDIQLGNASVGMARKAGLLTDCTFFGKYDSGSVKVDGEGLYLVIMLGDSSSGGKIYTDIALVTIKNLGAGSTHAGGKYGVYSKVSKSGITDEISYMIYCSTTNPSCTMYGAIKLASLII